MAEIPWWSYAPMRVPRNERGPPRSQRASRALGAALLPRQLAVDERLELLVGLRAREHDAVHEEGRGAVHAHLLARLLVRLDDLRLVAGVEALVELALVEAQLLRVALQ